MTNKIDKKEYRTIIMKYLKDNYGANGIQAKYNTIITLYDFLIQHRSMLYNRNNRFQNIVFNKLIEFSNKPFSNNKKERLYKLRSYKHALFPYSKLDNEDIISRILFRLIRNNDLVFIIILYSEPDMFYPII